jgi:hypothetical protein
MRSIHEQVAKELGQLVEKREVTGKNGGPLTIEMLDEILADTPKEELHGVISAASDEQLEGWWAKLASRPGRADQEEQE